MKKRVYILSPAILAVLSAYPLVNGVRIAILSARNGVLEPEQYAAYVVPYTAICVSVLLFAAFQPLLFKLKRFALPAGLAATYGVFLAVERFFERVQIYTGGMTLLDPSAMSMDSAAPQVTADLWQTYSCAISPVIMPPAYASRDRGFYVMEDSAYKVHYYLISLILITMVCGLVYSVGKAFRDGGDKRPLALRGISATALVSLCVFANTTAFFRQPAAIQTPLASVLTCLFFIALGVSAGVYAGSYLLRKKPVLRLGVPVLISVGAAAAMYAGEAMMMKGGLYRFGKGWFFDGLPGIVPAPIDILVVLLSGVMTWLVLSAARRWDRWPGKRTVIAAFAVCAAVAVSGTIFAAFAPDTADAAFDPDTSGMSGIFGCYVYAENIYTNLLSSFSPFGKLPYVYGFDEDSFIIANTKTGDVRAYPVVYENTPIGADEFSSKSNFGWLPDLSTIRERFLLAVMSDETAPEYGLYLMDGDLWLVEFSSTVWTIYRIERTGDTAFGDLERAYALYEGNPPTAPSPAVYENQMTLKDLYALARKGDALTPADFGPFFYLLTGDDFTVRRYDVVGGDTVFVHTGGDALVSAELLSRRTVDPSQTADLRDGFDAVAAYMNPLKSFMDISVDPALSLSSVYELLFDDDYFQSECLYYLNSHVEQIYVTFGRNERMTVKEALAERRVTVEEAVANGMGGVIMVPKDNPLGGEFTVLHHLHAFELNGEAFYPSKSFMYVVFGEVIEAYYDMDELAQILELYGYDNTKLRGVDPSVLTAIAGGNYISDTALAETGIQAGVGWGISSHTPVRFSVGGAR